MIWGIETRREKFEEIIGKQDVCGVAVDDNDLIKAETLFETGIDS